MYLIFQSSFESVLHNCC